MRLNKGVLKKAVIGMGIGGFVGACFGVITLCYLLNSAGGEFAEGIFGLFFTLFFFILYMILFGIGGAIIGAILFGIGGIIIGVIARWLRF